MKKKYMLIALAIIGTIGWCVPAGAETIIDLGTVEYMNSLQVDIDSNESLNLTFIASNMNGSDITVTNFGFDTLTNQTRFLFTSELVLVEWWMTSDHVEYIYQANNTGQLYQIRVNYTDLEIPLSPVELELVSILEGFDIDIENITDLCILIEELLCEFQDGYDEKNYSLALLSEDFEDLLVNYWNKTDDYNLTSEQLDNITHSLTNLTTKYDLLNDSYNATYSNWLSANGLLEKYRGFYTDVTTSTQDTIWFDGDQYNTNNGFRRRIEDLKFGQEMGSLYLIFAVILTVFVCFLIARSKFHKRNLSAEQLADKSGYPKESGLIDNSFSDKPSPNKSLTQKITNKIPFTKKENKSDPVAIRQMIDGLETKIGTKIDSMKTELKTELSLDVHEYVDEAIEENIAKKTNKTVKPA